MVTVAPPSYLLNAAGWGFFIIPLIIFFVWTWKGNWYTYDLGWMIMILDLGLWAVDLPSTLRHMDHHLNTATLGWEWYYAFAEYVVLAMMAWRGLKVLTTLFKKKEEVR